jgi:shikimate dehydrogenase
MMIQGKTAVVAIIGHPIGHSLSPVMQNAAFAACNIDFVYVPFAVSAEKLEQAVTGLKALGIRGFNVTIPHKTAIIPFLDRLDESAESAGAVNTVQVCESSLIGYNTDGDGLVDSLASDLDFIPGSEPILILGAGGAARGAIAALSRSGARRIIICNRSVEKAFNIKMDMNRRYPETAIEILEYHRITAEIIGTSSLLLNTTSLGMNGECIENINPAHLTKHAKVYDMVYSRSGTTRLVQDASAAGLKAVSGIGMLVAQGERAFAIWTGQKAPAGVMRHALNGIQ